MRSLAGTRPHMGTLHRVELAAELDGSVVHKASRHRRYSSIRAPRRSKGTATAAYSSGIQPILSSAVSLPSDITSSDDRALASSAGATKGAQSVAVPSAILVVSAAT